MNYETFGVSESERWIRQRYSRPDWLWAGGLLVAALILFAVNLGELPLRDWDEGLVAQVAREIWRSAPGSLTWLHPTLWGEPYTNKPPLMHLLIAATYAIGGVSEWTARLPGAILTALSVPILYGIGREVFHRRSPALFSALVYLTFLPVVRHGRLAMLDGAILCFMLLTFWTLLLARRNSRYALGVGLGLGLICLTKGVIVAVLIGTIALLFLLWDTPRLLRLPHLWLGIGLGIIPAAFWYGAQWLHYGNGFLGSNLVDQSLQRIWTPVEQNGGMPWYYLLELVKYSAPWLFFLPLGFRLTWFNRNLSWAKLVIVWIGIYFVAISMMATKLPWYTLPLYPALALVVGAQLTLIWHHGRQVGVPYSPSLSYSRTWTLLFAALAIGSGIGVAYFAFWSSPLDPNLQIILASVGLTMAVTAILTARHDPQFIAVLIWGMYISLMLLMLSQHWVWELAEAYPVKPVAAIVQQNTPAGQEVYTSYDYNRPSLSFYSDRHVIPASARRLQRYWRRDAKPYLLLDQPSLKQFASESPTVLGQSEGWTLITKKN